MKNLVFGLMLLLCGNLFADEPTGSPVDSVAEVATLEQLQEMSANHEKAIKQLGDNDLAIEKRLSELEQRCKCGLDEKPVTKMADKKTAYVLPTAVSDKPVTKAEVDAQMDKPMSMRDLVSMAAGYEMAKQEAKPAYTASAYASAPVPVSNVVRSTSGGSTGSVAAPSGGSTGSVPLPVSFDLGSVPLLPGETIVPGSVRVTNTVSAPMPASSGQAVYCVDQYGNRVPCNNARAVQSYQPTIQYESRRPLLGRRY